MKWTKSKYKHVNVRGKKKSPDERHGFKTFKMWKDKDVWRVRPRILTKQSKTLQQKKERDGGEKKQTGKAR